MVRAVIFDMYETLITLYESPEYFGVNIAEDAQIPVAEFKKLWDPTEDDRSTGKITLEEIVERILRAKDCYSDELFHKIVQKRIASKEESFKHLHREILPMLSQLHEHGVKIGVISNCFSEEAALIRQSQLFSYFDAVCLSYEEGMMKPDPLIYKRCMKRLDVKPEECLYVGDGGSHELEAAAALGMRACQAVWYLKDGTKQPCKRKPEFTQLERPMDVVCQIKQ